ncbi:MAG TPA: peroxide stress protein YaaA, partial [Cyclobacteriaceae bacterium]|nr:peroxide stress protein YaaA [Cyclobacteriaceae bacterium]
MITLISPAKTLDLKKEELPNWTEPQFQKEIQELVRVMKKKSKAGIQELMGVSENIAALNKERYKNFEKQFTPENSKPAIFTFKGDVYRKMDVETYTQEQIDFAQNHVRILSGLYGLLKPMDLIQPYRLEMGIRLKHKKYEDLYSYWKRKITSAIDT